MLLRLHLVRGRRVRALHEDVGQRVVAAIVRMGQPCRRLRVDRVVLPRDMVRLTGEDERAWVRRHALRRVEHGPSDVGLRPLDLLWLVAGLRGRHERFAVHRGDHATVVDMLASDPGVHVRVGGVDELLTSNLSLHPLVATGANHSLLHFALVLRRLRHFNGLRLLQVRVHHVRIRSDASASSACRCPLDAIDRCHGLLGRVLLHHVVNYAICS